MTTDPLLLGLKTKRGGSSFNPMRTRSSSQYLRDPRPYPPVIDSKKKFDMIIERRTVRKREGKEIVREEAEEENVDLVAEEYSLEFLLETDNHYQLLEHPNDFPGIIQNLFNCGKEKEYDFEKFFEFNHFYA
jgi:hypothetical protein